MSQAFGSAWNDGVQEFIDWLKNSGAQYVELDLQDWYGDKNGHEFKSHWSSRLSVFDGPLYEGKTFFTRKPKFSDSWKQEIESFAESDSNSMFE